MFAPSFVLAYHGCEKKVGEAILAGDDHVARSETSTIGSVTAHTSGKTAYDAPSVGPSF